jgi:hypothetical protein
MRRLLILFALLVAATPAEAQQPVRVGAWELHWRKEGGQSYRAMINAESSSRLVTLSIGCGDRGLVVMVIHPYFEGHMQRNLQPGPSRSTIQLQWAPVWQPMGGNDEARYYWELAANGRASLMPQQAIQAFLTQARVQTTLHIWASDPFDAESHRVQLPLRGFAQAYDLMGGCFVDYGNPPPRF